MIEKFKISELRTNLEIYGDVLKFIGRNKDLNFFVSVDDRQYKNFEKLVGVFDGENSRVVREGKLKKGSNEYKLSLIIDTLLNIEKRGIVSKLNYSPFGLAPNSFRPSPARA